MKLTIHIFTIYMLALSLIPCGDGGGGIVEIANHVFDLEHQHISDHDQHSNDCGDDTCTPFCICSCCSISVHIPTNVDFSKTENLPSFSQKLPSIISRFIPSGYNASVWHPPIFS